MRKMSQTTLFPVFSTKPEIKRALEAEFNATMDSLDQRVSDELVSDVLKRETSPFAHFVKESLKEGTIKFVYKSPYDALPAFLPITIKLDSVTKKPVALIMIQNYYSPDPNKPVGDLPKIKPSQLIGLLYGAEALKAIILKPTSFIRNEALIKALANSYSKMVFRILDREYGIGTMIETSILVKLAIQKFFMEYVLMMTDHERMNRMAIDNLPAPYKGQKTMINKLAGYENTHSGDPYADLSSLIELLKSISERFEKITVRQLFASVNAMYGETALLSLENAAYFILQFIFTFTKSNLNNGFSFEPVFKEEERVLSTALLKQLSA